MGSSLIVTVIIFPWWLSMLGLYYVCIGLSCVFVKCLFQTFTPFFFRLCSYNCFVEYIYISWILLNYFVPLADNQLNICLCMCFGPKYFLDYCKFMVGLEISTVTFPTLFFCKIFLAILDLRPTIYKQI